MVCFGWTSWSDPRQELRFQKPIRDLQRSLKKKSAEAVVDELIKNTNRADLFELEALLRVYEVDYADTLEGFLSEDIKPFEDELGKLLDLREGIAFSEKVGAPKRVLAYLKGREEGQREKFKNFLKDHQFIGEDRSKSPLVQLQEAVEETDWAGKKSDRKLVLKAFRKLFKEIEKGKYDMNQLEAGLHEFRRDLRWIPIYLRSFPDLFKLDNREFSAIHISKEDPILKSPYSKLPSPRNRVSFPILFPKMGLLALNKMVDSLGKAKDIGKMEELLIHALKESGTAPNTTQAKILAKALVKKHPDYVPVKPKAAALFKAVTNEETGIIPALSPMIKEQKEWKKRDCKDFLTALSRKR